MKKIVVFMLTSFLFIFSSVKADTIKLGILEDETGNFAIAVVPKIHAYELAVKEINANGGVLGKKLEVKKTLLKNKPEQIVCVKWNKIYIDEEEAKIFDRLPKKNKQI